LVAAIERPGRVPRCSWRTPTSTKARGLKWVALFGTCFTIETRIFGYLDGVDVGVKLDFPAIDCARIHIDAIVQRLIS